MTAQMKMEALAEFRETLDNLKMSDGHICYKQNYFYENCRATVLLSPEAYRKIVALQPPQLSTQKPAVYRHYTTRE
jgi:hypothetical protein